MRLSPIGVILTPLKQAKGAPVNVRRAKGIRGRVIVKRQYAAGLRDLRGFDRIWLIFWLDRAAKARMRVRPYMDTKLRGLFSTRAPARPNPIGISCVRLLSVRKNVLHVSDLDILDGTPLLDIKPYQPSDRFIGVRFGWMDRAPRRRAVADDRFTKRKKRSL